MADDNQTVLFALSTCGACRKTKALLNECGVDYLLVEVDTVDKESREKLLEKVRQYNSRETFPTLVIQGGKKVIVGFDEQNIRNTFSF